MVVFIFRNTSNQTDEFQSLSYSFLYMLLSIYVISILLRGGLLNLTLTKILNSITLPEWTWHQNVSLHFKHAFWRCHFIQPYTTYAIISCQTQISDIHIDQNHDILVCNVSSSQQINIFNFSSGINFVKDFNRQNKLI